MPFTSPNFLALLSPVPRQLELAGPISTLGQTSQKAILWSLPRRGGDIRCLEKLFFSPREKKEAMGFDYSFYTELRGGAMSSISPSCHLYSPPGS